MAPDVFDRETMLDLSVNVIPLFIILFFIVLFAAVAPFGYSLVDTTIQMALLVIPFIGLAILTYFSGKAIAEAEAKMEERGDLAHAENDTPGAHAGESTPDAPDAPDATEGDAESAVETRSTSDQD
ncbi:DUF6684 family protein [Halomarina litorea]|uniref:DUF6684 family protein n=1 Tax=Halomarina litorea TaxID=2961595 RepID=UPI0020C343D5|nr:DUF6684 family protein [Halomarina sp. BCD28]